MINVILSIILIVAGTILNAIAYILREEIRIEKEKINETVLQKRL